MTMSECAEVNEASMTAERCGSEAGRHGGNHDHECKRR